MDHAAVLAAFLAAHVLAAVVLAVQRRPQRGVLLLAALAPFAGLLLLVPHPPLVEGWKEALVLGTLLATFLCPDHARRRLPQPLPAWGPALLGFVAVAIASAVVVGGDQAVYGLKTTCFYMLLPVVLWRCPLSAGERDRLVSILMASAVVTAVTGLVQQLIGPAGLNALGYEYDSTIRTASGVLRSFSTFDQPFPFGLFLMLALLVCLPVALADWQRPRNAVFLLSTPLILAGMASSIVRAALAGTAIGLLFLWWHRDRVLAHAVPVVLVGLLFVPRSYVEPLLSSTSLGQRSSGWSATLDEVLQAPLGNGVGGSGSAAEKAASVAGNAAQTYQPDNWYFKTAFELGPIGLWLFVLVLLSAFVAAVRASRRSGQRPVPSTGVDAALAAGLAAAVLGAATASVVATFFEIFPVDLFFWLLLGVLSSLPTGSHSVPSPSGRAGAASRPTSASSAAD